VWFSLLHRSLQCSVILYSGKLLHRIR
jgi:hypothetical protein